MAKVAKTKMDQKVSLGLTMLSKAVGLSLRLGRLHTGRAVSTSMVEVDADKSMLRVAKDILDSPELGAIVYFDYKIRHYLRSTCLPSPLREGVYLVPVTLVRAVVDQLDEYAEIRNKLVKEFLAVYPKRKAEAKKRLRSLYDESQYPSVDLLATYFTMKYTFIGFDTPDQLNQIDPELFTREVAKAERDWASAVDVVRDALRTSMAELVSRMSQSLADGKRIRQTSIAKFTEFLDLFEKRNITSDAAMAALVNRARGIVSGVDAADVRDNDVFRAKFTNGVDKIKQDLDKLLEIKPRYSTRSIELDD